MQVGWRRYYRLLEAGVGSSIEGTERAHDVMVGLPTAKPRVFSHQLLRPTRRQLANAVRSHDLLRFSDRHPSPTDDLGVPFVVNMLLGIAPLRPPPELDRCRVPHFCPSSVATTDAGQVLHILPVCMAAICTSTCLTVCQSSFQVSVLHPANSAVSRA